MSVVEYNERIASGRRANQRLLAFYLAQLSQGGGGGFRPLPPNPNVVMFLTTQFEEAPYDDEPAPLPFRQHDLLMLLPTPITVTVPDVVGMLIADALTAIANASLTATFSYVQVGQPYNTVATQSIAGGTPVGPGTVIQLQVDNETVVPDLSGLLKDAAITALGAAVLGADPEPVISAFPPGTVFSQSIVAGTFVIANTVVTFQYAVSGDGFRVQAVTAGWYGGQFYNAGDVFDILQSSDFSDYTLNYEIAGAEYNAGWMKQVPQSTPLTLEDGSGFLVTLDPNRRFVE